MKPVSMSTITNSPSHLRTSRIRAPFFLAITVIAALNLAVAAQAQLESTSRVQLGQAGKRHAPAHKRQAGLPAAGTLTAAPVSASIAGAQVTFSTTVMDGAAYASGSFTFSSQPASEVGSPGYPGVAAGDVVFWFDCASGSTGSDTCNTTDYSDVIVDGNSVILIGDTLAHTVANVVAAFNNDQAQCGYVDPTETDNGYNTCFVNGAALDNGNGAAPPQNYVVAGGSGDTVTLTAATSGTGGNCAGTCWTSYGWSANNAVLGNGDTDENFTPTTGGLTGGLAATGAASGTATFTDSVSGTLCSNVVLDGAGSASCPTAALAAGTHTITVSYTLNNGYTAAPQSIFYDIVQGFALGSVAVSPASPSVFGEPVTFTATVGVDGFANANFMFTAQPESEDSNSGYSGLRAGDVVWWYEAASGSTCTAGCASTDYSGRIFEGHSTILIGDTIAHTAQNVAAAVNNDPGLCGYVDPTPTDNGYNTCYYNGTTLNNSVGALPPQSFVTANASADTVTLLAAMGGAANDCNGSATSCWTSYGFVSNEIVLGGSDIEQMSPVGSGLNNGAGNMSPATGTATFTDSVAGAICNSVALSAGVATCSTSALAAGPHIITISYSLTGGYAASNNALAYSVQPGSISGSFSVSPASSSVLCQPVTFDATATLAAYATGTIQFTAQPFSEVTDSGYSGFRTGNVVWWFECAEGSTSASECPTTDYNSASNSGQSAILIGDTIAHTAQNLAAAISNNSALCGYLDPNMSDNGYNTCFHNGTILDNGVGALPPQAYVTATASGNYVTLQALAPGTTGNCTGTCWTGYGWSSNNQITNGSNIEGFGPTAGGLSGGLAGPLPAGGSVTFTDNVNGVLCNDVALSGGAAMCQTSALSIGAHSISAAYTLPSGYSLNPAPIPYTVNQASSTTTLTSNPNSSTGGQAVTFTITVSPAPTACTGLGSVTLKANGTTIASHGLLTDYDGVVNIDYSSLTPAGSPYTMQAFFSGDEGIVSSTSTTIYQTVNAEPTTTTLMTNSSAITFGQSVTLTATVSDSNGVTPTGAVTFKNGSTTLGNAALVKSGTGTATATLTLNDLPAGTDSLTAGFPGTNLLAGSTSSASTVVVASAASTTTLTSSTSPSVWSQVVTFSATVAPANGGLASGTVEFTKGGAAIGTGTVANNKASLNVSDLAVGSFTIGATFTPSNNVNGVPNVSGSTATSITQVVDKANSNTALTVSPTSCTTATAFTLTATVTTVAPGTGTASPGAVVFYRNPAGDGSCPGAGADELGTENLSSGKATYKNTLPCPAPGTYNFCAVFTGNSYVNESTSPNVAYP